METFRRYLCHRDGISPPQLKTSTSAPYHLRALTLHRPRVSLRYSVGGAPHPIPLLSGHLADKASRCHQGEVALDGGAAGTGQGLGHWSGDDGPFGQHRAQCWWCLARERGHHGFRPH